MVGVLTSTHPSNPKEWMQKPGLCKVMIRRNCPSGSLQPGYYFISGRNEEMKKGRGISQRQNMAEQTIQIVMNLSSPLKFHVDNGTQRTPQRGPLRPRPT